jgi:hypothetical protein
MNHRITAVTILDSLVSATYIVSIGGLIVVFASTMVIATDPLPVTQTAVGRRHALNKAQKRTQARAHFTTSSAAHIEASLCRLGGRRRLAPEVRVSGFSR